MRPSDIRAGIRRLFRLDVRRSRETAGDADGELEAMTEEEVRYLLSRGMPEDRAREVAATRLGQSPALARALVRQSAERRERRLWWREWLSDAGSDVRYAARNLRQSPTFAATAMLTLALAIGANTSIFSAVDAVLLRPLPFAEPDRLVALWESNPDFGWTRQDAAPANLFDWQEQAKGFAGVAGYERFRSAATLTGRGEPILLRTQRVTGNFFSVLGIRPAIGRVFRDEETWAPAGTDLAVLADRTWRERFGGDPGIVGSSIRLDGREVRVVGVAPRGFAMPGLEIDLWQPVAFDPNNRPATWFRRAHFLGAIARLAPGRSLEEADAALQVVVQRLQRDYPATNTRMGAGITPLQDFLVGQTRLPLLVMLAAVALLLVIACANVANLLLVRAAGREREIALRRALGAGRLRLLRQSLTEGAVLAALGGIAGVGLGWLGIRLLSALRPADLLPVRELTMSGAVLGYALAVGGVAALAFGVAPVVWSRGRAPAEALRDAGSSLAPVGRRAPFGDLLLVLQVALALALTVGAGLLTRSYLRLRAVDPGFEPKNVLAVGILLNGLQYDTEEKILAFFEELRREAAALPGVSAAALASKIPLGPPSWTSQFAVRGRDPIAAGTEILHREVSPGYLEVMRVPLVRGRTLGEGDTRGAPLVVVVNETFARAFFSGEDPVGQMIAFDRVPDSTSFWRTIVGVVGNERQTELALEPRPEVFAPYTQEFRRSMTLLIRTRGAPEPVAPSVRRLVARLDPSLAIVSLRTMDQVWGGALARDRFLMTLIASFAAVGLVLGVVGVYGVVAQAARRRSREVGIRLALGGGRVGVQWLVIRRGVALAVLGILLGAAGAASLAGVVRSLLYDVAPLDPTTFVLVPVLMLATAAAASWIPAARASRTDPSLVLRSD